MQSGQDTATFKYQPLDAYDSFRILLVQPASSYTAQVECGLLHTTLSYCDRDIIDHYTALSYVWGDASQTRPILLDGHEVFITATLEAALRDLRDETRTVRLWADALCIDQSSVDERSMQVRQMGRIYSTAHHTVIYLGSLTDTADAVLQAVPSRNNLDSDSKARLLGTAESDLLKRPWFRRVWVFQELVLSRDPWVQCGNIRVRWMELCDFLLPRTRSTTDGTRLLKDMQDARAGGGGWSLFNLLVSRRALGATDPRDLIYAQLGLVADHTEMNSYFLVDYQRSVSRIYQDVARYLLDKIGPESFFFQIDLDRSDSSPDLPSWVPDWRAPPSYSGSMFKDNSMKVLYLKAKAYYAFLEEESILAFMGYDVEVVSNTSFILPKSTEMNAAHRERYQETVKSIEKLYASQGGVYGVGDENGQYSRISLRGKMEEHNMLCKSICEEWFHILGNELPLSFPSAASAELDSHKRFLETFTDWITARAKEEIVFVGANCADMLKHLYYHLLPNPIGSILSGRRLASMRSGRIGLVPSQARDGDLVVYFAGSPTSILLRKFTPSSLPDVRGNIIEALKAKDGGPVPIESRYFQSYADLFASKSVPLEHVKFMGECYVDGVVGWRHNQVFDHKIFALH